jgi:glycosyltransferase involved in cell wall biosynthesis
MGKELLKNSWLHVSTEMEWKESQKIVPDWKGRIVPNLVKLSHQTYARKQNNIFTIGFLSRIDPKKGLDTLIKALAKVSFEYQLVVAGSGEDTYLNFLKQLSADCGNADKIKWLGWKNGEDKFEFLSELDLFALTSHSENFAIVVIESLSVGTPVFVSEHVGLYKYISQNDYGWVTDMNVDNIVEKLNAVVTEKQKLTRINATVPYLIRKEFDGSTLTKEYIKLYNMVTEDKS